MHLCTNTRLNSTLVGAAKTLASTSSPSTSAASSTENPSTSASTADNPSSSASFLRQLSAPPLGNLLALHLDMLLASFLDNLLASCLDRASSLDRLLALPLAMKSFRLHIRTSSRRKHSASQLGTARAVSCLTLAILMVQTSAMVAQTAMVVAGALMVVVLDDTGAAMVVVMDDTGCRCHSCHILAAGIGLLVPLAGSRHASGWRFVRPAGWLAVCSSC
jgi:hypothetical protein